MIGVVDYEAGNAPSVLYALAHLGIEAQAVRGPEDVARSDRLILPGVGAAFATMRSLRELGLVEALEQAVRRDGKRFLGVCVGLQLLFEASDEDDVPCLGLLPGRAVAMGFADRVPHMGWNDVTPQADHPLARALPAVCYFAHSYAVEPAEAGAVLGTTELGGRPFASVAGAGRVTGTQFHPKKSGPARRENLSL